MDVPAPQGITVRDAGKQFNAVLNPKPDKAAVTPDAENKTPESPAPASVEAPAENQPADETPIAQEQPTYKVRVDGEELEVPLDDLLRGYSRTSDYTRKTQALAESRKTAEAELTAVREERQHYAQALTTLKAQLSAETEPDWQKLINEDPIEYVRQDAIHRRRRESLAAVESEQHRLAEIAAADQQKQLTAHIEEEERKLVATLSEWADPKKAKVERERVIEYAREIGFTDGELAGLYDHRAVIALREASLYRKMVAEAKKKVESVKDAPKTSRPGNMQTQVVDKGLTASRDRFYQSHSIRDAGAFMNRLLAQKPKGT